MGAYAGAAIDLQVQPDGTVRDAVSGTLATITRSGSKWGIDPFTGMLKDFGANRLAAEKYPNGGGYWAAIEETRTNYATQSAMTVDSDADGLADKLMISGYDASDQKALLDASGFLSGAKWQKVALTGAVAATIYQGRVSIQDTLTGLALAPNTSYTFSFFYRNAYQSGCNPAAFIEFGTAANAYVSIAGATSTGGVLVCDNSPTVRRCTYTITTPASIGTAVKINARMGNSSLWHPGDTFGIEFTGVQLELGAGATTYIPTTTVPVTRPADVVTFPSAALSVSAGTVAAVIRCPATTANNVAIVSMNPGLGNQFRMSKNGTLSEIRTRVYDAAVAERYGLKAFTAGATAAVAGRWDGLGDVDSFVGGSSGSTAGAGSGVITAFPSFFYIASQDATVGKLNEPLHRLVAFNTALSDAEIAALSTALLAGTRSARRRQPVMSVLGGITRS